MASTAVLGFGASVVVQTLRDPQLHDSSHKDNST